MPIYDTTATATSTSRKIWNTGNIQRYFALWVVTPILIAPLAALIGALEWVTGHTITRAWQSGISYTCRQVLFDCTRDDFWVHLFTYAGITCITLFCAYPFIRLLVWSFKTVFAK